MLPAFLICELLIHIFNDGWVELVLTAIALALSIYAWPLAGMVPAQLRAEAAQNPDGRGPRCFSLQVWKHRPGALLHLIIGLHVWAGPPWFLFMRYGQFFCYGFHLLALVGAVSRWWWTSSLAQAGESAQEGI